MDNDVTGSLKAKSGEFSRGKPQRMEFLEIRDSCRLSGMTGLSNEKRSPGCQSTVI